MIDLAVAVLAVIALVALVVMVARKFPMLAAINTKAIPAEQHGELKSRLMEDRLRRKVKTALSAVGIKLKPVGSAARIFLKQRYERLLELERRYRSRVTSGTAMTPEEQSRKNERLDVLLNSATSALRNGEFAPAERNAIEAISVDPRSAQAYRILVEVYLGMKDFEHARETLQFMIERLHVEDDEVYAELSQVASGEGNLEEAKRDLEKSILLNSQAAEHYLDLSRVHLELGDSQAAFESCRRAVELEPNNPKFLDALVDASVVAGKRGWAEDTLEKLRAVNPDNQKLAEFSARIEHLPQQKSKR